MRKRVLTVGLGIAGMAAAIALRDAGWSPVIVERAPERRRGGYFVGLMPEGRRAAADLGVTADLHVRDPDGGGAAWDLDRRGKRAPGRGFLDQPGHPAAMIRGDVEAALWEGVSERGHEGIEIRFSTTIDGIEEAGGEMRVLLRDGAAGREYEETFDLVVGADGMRSTVRRLVFGPHEDHLTDWHAIICAFQLDEQVPSYAPQDSITSARAGRAAWVFGLADRTPTALLTYRVSDTAAEFDGNRFERVRAAFAGMDDPVVRHLLGSLERAPEFLFDSVHQVTMPKWSAGRVVLTGDAAWCMNLYSVMGASSALRGGVALGTALGRRPDDVRGALAEWEADLRPAFRKHQRIARLKQQMFVPSGRATEMLRSSVVRFAGRTRVRTSAQVG